MQEFVLAVMENYGYFGVCFLIAIENIFPPIPSELILLFGGFMTTKTSLNIILMIIFATLGSLIGAIVLYYIGKILNKDRLKKIVSGKIGKILRVKTSDIDMADAWFDNKGNITVFFCRFIPIVRSLISIPAGMSEMPMLKFLIYTIVGSAIWNTVLIIIGNRVGENWESILAIFDKYSLVVVILLIIIFIGFIIWFYKFRKPSKKSKTM
ncbi:MAG: DedA family protein [Bacilli bacterium]